MRNLFIFYWSRILILAHRNLSADLKISRRNGNNLGFSANENINGLLKILVYRYQYVRAINDNGTHSSYKYKENIDF